MLQWVNFYWHDFVFAADTLRKSFDEFLAQVTSLEDKYPFFRQHRMILEEAITHKVRSVNCATRHAYAPS